MGGVDVAVLEVSDKWTPNKALEAPGVQMIAMERGKYYIGGKVTGMDLPKRIFPCATPRDTRAGLPEDKDVVAFQCRNPLHRVHVELFLRSLDAENVGDGA